LNGAGAAPRTAGVAGVDADAVSGWIATLDVGEAAPLQFARLGRGQSNLTYLVSDAHEQRWVLRRPPLGHLLDSAHDVVREHRVLRALQQTQVPAPAVYGLCQDTAVSDVPLLLMEHVNGLVVDDMAIAESLEPALRGAIGRSLARTLATIHAVDLEQTGLDSIATHAPYAARQLKRWRAQWEHSRSRELPIIEQLAERLQAAIPEPGELTLVHGDFHLLNVIISPLDGGVRAVLDWELCTLGDPLADLGGLLAYWPQPGDPAEALFPAPALPGFPDRAELSNTYAELTGRSLESVGFWHVLGLWKLAIIAHGVLRRALDEPLNTPSGAVITARTVDDILIRAEAIAKDVGL
jgi:aminoglycoside phosphotransferase (APT) family kinase protein